MNNRIAVVGLCLALGGCAALPLPLGAIRPGETQETQARALLGEPGRVWEALAGPPVVPRALEYSMQPNGRTSFMVDIGPDGKVAAVRQVLTPENLTHIKPGMEQDTVLRMLGRPMKISVYSLKRETYYDWRFFDGPNLQDGKVFTVVFDTQLKVVSTASAQDPAAMRRRGVSASLTTPASA
jgi:hypothetical protein